MEDFENDCATFIQISELFSLIYEAELNRGSDSRDSVTVFSNTVQAIPHSHVVVKEYVVFFILTFK